MVEVNDDGLLCLNIVATPVPVAARAPSREKPKRKGKWRRQPEKRGERRLQTKHNNDEEVRIPESTKVDDVEDKPTEKAAKPSQNVSFSHSKNQTEPTRVDGKDTEDAAEKKNNATTATTTKNQRNVNDAHLKKSFKRPLVTKKSEKNLGKRPKHHSNYEQPRRSIATSTVDDDEDHHPENSTQKPPVMIEDTQERADYLARYHAHPKELDRRNQTVRNVPNAKRSDHLFTGTSDWKFLGVSDFFIQRLERQKFTAPTTIQAKALQLPHHKHVLIHSETGSGKTLAYLLPILQSMPREKSRHELSLSCLILVPTRELAYQIYDMVNALTAGTNLIPGITVGAEKRSAEKAKLRKGLPILIGTPGRIMDHVESTKNFDLTKIHTIVLDEVDRLLLDRPEVIAQLIAGATNRQSLILVSATCDATVEKFTTEMINADWQHVRETAMVPQQLQMLQLTVHAKYRFPALMALLGTHESGDTVVFCSTCASVDYYHALFEKSSLSLLDNLDSMKLHGNMELADRAQSITQFRSSTAARRKVLWTTDVAARGLNLSSQIIRILQYDPPTELSDYLHRAGRTARAGNAGTCLIFTLPTESRPFTALLREKTDNPSIILPISLNETLEAAARYFPNLPKTRTADAVCLEISKHFEHILYQFKDLLELAKTAFLAHIRAYAVKEKALKSVFVARGLHLGHVARSFMLKDPPTSLSAKAQKKKTTTKPSGGTQHKKSQLLFNNASKLEGMDSL